MSRSPLVRLLLSFLAAGTLAGVIFGQNPVAAVPEASPEAPDHTWRVLLITIPSTDVVLQREGRHVATVLTRREVIDAAHCFAALPRLADRLSGGNVQIDARRVDWPGTLTRVSPYGDAYVPLAGDVAEIIKAYDESGRYDTIGVLWSNKGIGGPWGIGGSLTPCGNTYFAVSQASTAAWEAPSEGEVFLHEWLHGVATHYRRLGFAARIAPKDADGGEAYGFTRSPTLGWSPYYAALMNERVPVNGRMLGFGPDMWTLGGPRAARNRAAAAERGALGIQTQPSRLSLPSGGRAKVDYTFGAEAAGATLESRRAYFATPKGLRLSGDLGPYPTQYRFPASGAITWADQPYLPSDVVQPIRCGAART